MKDILVILTGGTLGSCIKNGSIDIDNSSKCMVVEKYKELYEKELKCTKPDHTAQNNDSDTDVTDRFEVRESFSILSENSTVSYLNALLTEEYTFPLSPNEVPNSSIFSTFMALFVVACVQ